MSRKAEDGQMDGDIRIASMTNTLQIIGCHVGKRGQNWSFPTHHHPLFELLYCREGKVELTVEQEQFTLAAGELLLLRPGVKHGLHNNGAGPYRFVNLHFNTDDQELRSHLSGRPYAWMAQETLAETRLPESLQQVTDLLRRQSQTMESDAVGEDAQALPLDGWSKLMLQSLVLLMISETAMLLHRRAESDSAAMRYSSATEVELAHAVEALIRDTRYTRHTITEVARHLNVSRSQCYKVFTKVYGMSPRQYLSELTLSQAKQHLLDNALTIDEIAEAMGFSSTSHFSRQFKRWTGVAPTQYRPRIHLSDPPGGATSSGDTAPSSR
ncbi:AraC family transcriptional regulator [Paenibacillus sp. 598K]|uniref:helix-turn-helix domain-containing protein n=1 Tax=Paenibacillus sp. 598K TaxID=1117987 RepID=UPI000FFA8FA1|nr:AraC family transcriptional regulator [Paenibacillus sp. 598K]GBF72533.1 AraC family transcriptional regulator [Paenibacillus sp. 598K]